MNVYDEILFEEIPGKEGNLGVITLNRPQVLNSLNHSMVLAMTAHLTRWSNIDNIKAVIIRATEGRAFCAGGDLRLTYDRFHTKKDLLTEFFRDEYKLNRLIFHFPKPYIALLDGITMGGGVGISVHGSHRVATERLLFAMPETGIGFFPDVGGSYFLPRLPNHTGFYLGLTGDKIRTDDCVALGIATNKVLSHELPKLMDAFIQEPLTKPLVSELIDSFSLKKPTTFLSDLQNDLDKCFSKDSMEEIFAACRQNNNPACKEWFITMGKKSPTSLKVTLRAMQKGQNLNFDACMGQEYRLVSRFLKGHDFYEGIRAIIIDKDQSPIWEPAILEEVTKNDVDKYFAPLPFELT